MANTIEKDWTTKAGLRAVVIFIHDSHRCGYVAVGKDHPLYGVGYGDPHPALRMANLEDTTLGKRGILPVFCHALRDEGEDAPMRADVYFNVHGGITYSDGGHDYPAKGDDLWWFGYDCLHAGDIRAKDIGGKWDHGDGVFRELDYCEGECESLAAQLERVREVAVRSAV